MVLTKIALILSLLLVAFAAPANAQTKSPGKHDPLVDAQLRGIFARMDLNKDSFLDATELARAFRGSKAVALTPLAYDDTGKPKPDAGFDRKYKDQVYLYALDKDFDGQISWAEFVEYGEAYAAAVKGQQLNLQKQQAAYFQTMQKQQAMYLQAQRNFLAAQARRVSYSSRSSRYQHTNHPPARHHTYHHTYHPPIRRR